MAGIKETKEALLFGIGLAMKIDEVTQDGFQWTEVFELIPPLTKLPEAVSGAEEIPAELADMDEAERAELIEEVKKLDFASEYSEEVAEQGLRVGLEVANLILLLRAVRADSDE